MPDLLLSRSDLFPPGASVTAHARGSCRAPGVVAGPVIETQTVASNGVATFHASGREDTVLRLYHEWLTAEQAANAVAESAIGNLIRAAREAPRDLVGMSPIAMAALVAKGKLS